VPDGFVSPAPKMRTSADSWQVEGSSLESCCSASSAHGTARTEAQGLSLLSCLANLKFKCSLGMGGVPASLPPSSLLRKCERLQIAGRQKGLAWKAVAQPHLPMALASTEAQRLGLFSCLATSNFKCRYGNCRGGYGCFISQPCFENANACR